MTEDASLVIKVNAETADQAAASLNNMVGASGRAEAATAALGAEARAAMAGLTGISGAIADFDTRASRLKASVDPLGAAMDRVNAEMREADALYKVGAIGANEYAQGMSVLETRLEAAVGAQNALTAAQMRGSKAAGFTAAETLNLSRQFADIGVSAAMGMNPLMILIQQGPQIADIFGTSAARGNTFAGSMVAVGKQLGLVTGTTTAAAAATLAQAEAANLAAQAELRLATANFSAAGGAEAAAAAAAQAAVANTAMAEAATAAAAAETAALAPLALIIGAVVAGLAIMGAGFAVAAHEMNEGGESADQLQKRLGLTDEQMKKVGNSAITMGDVIIGSAKVTGQILWESFGPTLTKIGTFFHDVFEAAVANIVGFARDAVGTLAAAYGGITAVWSMLPAAMGDIAITAANAVITATETMINGAIGLINDLGEKANLVAIATGSAIRVPTLTNVEFGKLTDSYEGAGAAAMAAYADGAKKNRDAALAQFDALGGRYGAGIRGERDSRVRREGGDGKKAGKDAGSSAEADEAKRAIKAAEDYIKALKDEAATLGLSAIAAKEYEIAQRAALAPTKELAQATRDAGLALTYKMQVQATGLDAMQQQIDLLTAEKGLIGASAKERAVALAVMQEEERLRKAGVTDELLLAQAIAKRRELAALPFEIKEAQSAYNSELTRTLELLQQVDSHARDAASSMASAFGDVSKSLGGAVKAFGGVMTALTGLAAREEAIDVDRKARVKEAEGNAVKIAHIEIMAARESAQAKIGAYGDMAAAGRTFFEEGSGGYRAMQAAEIAFRSVEMVMSIQAMSQKAAETAANVTAAGTQASAWGVAAFAKTLASLPFPFNLAAGAVVLAALAGIGVAISGGSGSAPGANDAQNRQDRQGAGSVLGDSQAKTESLVRATELVAEHTNQMLEFNNAMAKSLRSIDDQIGTVAAALAKSLGVGGMLDSSKLGLGSSTAGPGGLTRLFVPLSNLLPGLFGSKTTKTLQDQGLQFNATTLESALSGGLSGKTFQQILEKTSNQFLGLTYSESSKKRTVTGAMDPDFLHQTELLIGSLRDGVLSAASVLGIEGAEATLAAFKVDLGKISFKDLSGEEITRTLEAVFGKVADGMASTILPALIEFQKVGEGGFETLTRLARQYQVVDTSLASIGKVFGAVGVSSLAAREHLVDLFGGLDAFTDQTAFYADTFLSAAERLAPIQAAVTAELARLGIVSVDTRAEFKDLVQGLDVSTAAGAGMYAALMAIAPAFAAVTEESQALADAKGELSQAYDRESDALAGTLDRFKGFASSLKAYGASLYSGPSAALSPEAQYRASQAEFARVAALASTGNENALGDLQSVSEAYLNASKAYYASSTGYFQDLDAVRAAVAAAEASAGVQVDVAQQQLDQLRAMVGGFVDLNENVVSVVEAIAALNGLLGGGPAGQLPAMVTSGGGSAANDNSGAILTQLQQSNETLQDLVETQRASLEQQAAIFAEERRQRQEQIDMLSRQLREQQAS